MKKRKGDDWFPFWIDKWIFGSTRDELTVEQCAVWVDFLALSYKDEGYIRANEGIPYPIKRLSGLLNRPEKLIQQTIDRCLDPRVNKLRLDPDGTLYVLSHPEYELSKRHKRRLSEDDVRQKGHGVQKKDAKSREEKSREEKNRKEKAEKLFKKEFDEFWKIYNYKISKEDAFNAFKALRRKGITLEIILKAVSGYKQFIKARKIHDNFDQDVKYPAGFLRKDFWKDYLDFKYKPPM